ncbi:hypothetical protein ACK8P5_25010 [Paenibacillus sp. EC2-1]|uniref:hypothetical protein n=1 Tax=Paenibacillus sp. EC2-1 TaxID=3388665 RepID=UPI003BEF0695
MYLVSQPKPLSDHQKQLLECEYIISFPPGYVQFMRRFGEGAYSGWMNVHLPDSEVLKPFVEYELWEHDEDSPITAQQIGECIAVGTTVDGDFLAVHPEVEQLLWLPRHSDHIMALTLQMQQLDDDMGYVTVLNDIYRQSYGCVQETPMYYEPWSGSRNHLFLRLPPGKNELSLPVLANMCQEEFAPDLSIDTEYTCYLFYQSLGGYVRFNYANQQEVAIMYEQEVQEVFDVMKKWLLMKGCERYST